MDLYSQINRWMDRHVSAPVFFIGLGTVLVALLILPISVAYVLIYIFLGLIPIVMVLQLMNIVHILKARGSNWQHPRCHDCNRKLPLEDDGITPKKCED